VLRTAVVETLDTFTGAALRVLVVVAGFAVVVLVVIAGAAGGGISEPEPKAELAV
jgi:hypothetical protein